MKYAHSRADLPSENLASGRVLFSRPGFTAFPVRLASELFLRAIALLARCSRIPPYHLYDPTCGGGYLAVSLGFLHGDLLHTISMSDISDKAVAVASKNAALLTPEGLSRRRAELRELAERHGRESHRAACRSAARLLTLQRSLTARAFRADATCAEDVAQHFASLPPIDIAIADVPYGKQAHWHAGSSDAPETDLLVTLARLNVPVVALATDKRVTFEHPGFERCGKHGHGHRRLWLFRNRNSTGTSQNQRMTHACLDRVELGSHDLNRASGQVHRRLLRQCLGHPRGASARRPAPAARRRGPAAPRACNAAARPASGSTSPRDP